MIVLTASELRMIQHLVLGERLEVVKRVRLLSRQGAHDGAEEAQNEADMLNVIAQKVHAAMIEATSPNLTPVPALHNNVVSMEHHRRKRFAFYNGETEPEGTPST